MVVQKIIGDKKCFISGNKTASDVLILAIGEHDLKTLDSLLTGIRESTGEHTFLFAAFLVESWYTELPPWDAPAVFGREPFQAGADVTLHYILHKLIPELTHGNTQNRRFFLGGFSLSGLFALWAAYQTDLFHGIMAVSPSVWFPGWENYIQKHSICAKRVYLSLGDKEEKVKNKVMAKVGDTIRLQYALLSESTVCSDCILEWNSGGHFADSVERTLKGVTWILRQDPHSAEILSPVRNSE